MPKQQLRSTDDFHSLTWVWQAWNWMHWLCWDAGGVCVPGVSVSVSVASRNSQWLTQSQCFCCLTIAGTRNVWPWGGRGADWDLPETCSNVTDISAQSNCGVACYTYTYNRAKQGQLKKKSEVWNRNSKPQDSPWHAGPCRLSDSHEHYPIHYITLLVYIKTAISYP